MPTRGNRVALQWRMTTTFQDLGLAPSLLAALEDVGYEAPTPIQARDDPAAARRARPDRPGADRHRQDRGVRAADPAGARLRPTGPCRRWCSRPRASWPSRWRRRSTPTASDLGRVRGRCRSTAASRSSRSRSPAGARRPRRGRHAGPDHGPPAARHAPPRRACAWWCSTRRTRCCAWASSRTWSGSSARRRRAGRQTALFSATMPPEIRRIAERHLQDPVAIEIARKTLTVPAIEQRYLHVPQRQKLDALTRLLETEPTEAVLIFTRTKTARGRGGREARGARLRGRGDARRHEPGAARAGHPAPARAARSRSWWRPTWRPAGSTWSASATS